MHELWEMLMAAMTDTPQTGVPQSGVLCVHEDPCLMGTPQSAAFHIDGSAGYSFFFLFWLVKGWLILIDGDRHVMHPIFGTVACGWNYSFKYHYGCYCK